jgi:hypothetical protein
MKLSIFGRILVIGEIDKHRNNVIIGVVDKTGKGAGIYIEPEPIFERS